MCEEYYQLGGFHSQIQWYVPSVRLRVLSPFYRFKSTYIDGERPAEAVVSTLRSGNDASPPLELVLGEIFYVYFWAQNFEVLQV